MKKTIKIIMSIVAVLAIALTVRSIAADFSSAGPRDDKHRTFVKTKNRCTKSNCSCSGYWGYKHGNGTYEGACSNTDGHGHTCGHGPEKHGLRKW